MGKTVQLMGGTFSESPYFLGFWEKILPIEKILPVWDLLTNYYMAKGCISLRAGICHYVKGAQELFEDGRERIMVL